MSDLKMEEIKTLEKKYKRLISSGFLEWKQVKEKKDVIAVYMIYSSKTSKKPIYIGHTGHLGRYFSNDLKNHTTHSLSSKLKKIKKFDNKEINYYLTNKCTYKVIKCKSKREAECLEYFSIWILDPSYNK